MSGDRDNGLSDGLFLLFGAVSLAYLSMVEMIISFAWLVSGTAGWISMVGLKARRGLGDKKEKVMFSFLLLVADAMAALVPRFQPTGLKWYVGVSVIGFLVGAGVTRLLGVRDYTKEERGQIIKAGLWHIQVEGSIFPVLLVPMGAVLGGIAGGTVIVLFSLRGRPAFWWLNTGIAIGALAAWYFLRRHWRRFTRKLIRRYIRFMLRDEKMGAKRDGTDP